jgi:hypothetical protein
MLILFRGFLVCVIGIDILDYNAFCMVRCQCVSHFFRIPFQHFLGLFLHYSLVLQQVSPHRLPTHCPLVGMVNCSLDPPSRRTVFVPSRDFNSACHPPSRHRSPSTFSPGNPFGELSVSETTSSYSLTALPILGWLSFLQVYGSLLFIVKIQDTVTQKIFRRKSKV